MTRPFQRPDKSFETDPVTVSIRDPANIHINLFQFSDSFFSFVIQAFKLLMAPKPTFNYSWQDIDDGELTPIESSDEEPDPEPDFPAPSSVAPTPKIREVHTKATRPSTQQATKQSRDRIAAKSSPYLRSPRTTTYSLSSLHGISIFFIPLEKKPISLS